MSGRHRGEPLEATPIEPQCLYSQVPSVSRPQVIQNGEVRKPGAQESAGTVSEVISSPALFAVRLGALLDNFTFSFFGLGPWTPSPTLNVQSTTFNEFFFVHTVTTQPFLLSFCNTQAHGIAGQNSAPGAGSGSAAVSGTVKSRMSFSCLVLAFISLLLNKTTVHTPDASPITSPNATACVPVCGGTEASQLPNVSYSQHASFQ